MRETGRKKTVVLFGGTWEGHELARSLTGAGYQVLLCVATDYGRQVLGELEDHPLLEVRTGRMDEKEMEDMLRRRRPWLVIDATHPYAWLATCSIRKACAGLGLKVLRCIRPGSFDPSEENQGEVLYFSSPGEAADYLGQAAYGRDRPGILLTTGSKELKAFAGIPDFSRRVYARVLPSHPALEACFQAGLEGRHVIAMQGPFCAATNAAQLEEFDCGWLVTKDTGEKGGFGEKLEGARRAGARVAVIARPGQESGFSVEEILAYLTQTERREEG